MNYKIITALLSFISLVQPSFAAEELIGPKLPEIKPSETIGPQLPASVYSESNPNSATPKLTDPPVINKRPEREPLYRFSFDGGISYQSTLLQVIKESVSKTPTAYFEIVSYLPVTGDLNFDQDIADEAYRNAKQVYDYLIENGIPSTKINVRYTTNSGASTNDIAVFAVPAPQY